MNTFIDKALDSLIKEAKQLPNFLIFLLLFVSFFTTKAKHLLTILKTMYINVFPKNITTFIDSILISNDQFVEIWKFLLVALFFVFIMNTVDFFIFPHSDGVLTLGGEKLTNLNSVIFLFILIYNKLTHEENMIRLSLFKFSSIYNFVCSLSFCAFILVFSGIYLEIIFGIFKRINLLSKYKRFYICLFSFGLLLLLIKVGIMEFVLK